MHNADGYQRQSIRANADYRLKSWANVALSVSHVRATEEPALVSLESFARILPDVNLLAPEASGRSKYVIFPDATDGYISPFYAQTIRENEMHRRRTLADLRVSYRPFSFLTLDGLGSHDGGSLKHTEYTAPGTIAGQGLSTGSCRIAADTTSGTRLQGGATAAKAFREFNVQLTARGETQRGSHAERDSVGTNFSEQGVPSSIVVRNSNSEGRLSAAFVNVGADYARKYLGEVLVRRERDPSFALLYPWNVFTRASAAWLVSEERWFPASISLFKLRYSAATRKTSLDDDAPFPPISGAILNPGPDKGSEREAGLDMVAAHRLAGSFTYTTTRSNTGYSDLVDQCVVGLRSCTTRSFRTEARTLEAILQTRVVNANAFQWDVGLVGDHHNGKITTFSRTCFSEGIRYYCSNTPINTMWGHRLARDRSDLLPILANSTGLFDINDEGYLVAVGTGNTWRDGKAKNLWGTTVRIDGREYGWGLPFVAVTSDGVPVFSQIGDANPTVSYGLRNTLNYRGIRLYAQVTGQIGGDVYNQVRQTLYNAGNHPDIDQSSRPDELRKPVAYYRAVANSNSDYQQSFVESATHLRLSEASVGYDFTAARFTSLKRFGARDLRVDLVGRNLFTLSNYTGLSPQGTTFSRIDNINYPTTRTYTLVTAFAF